MGKSRETQGGGTGWLGGAIPHALMWKALDILHRDLVYWLTCSMCPEFYKPQKIWMAKCIQKVNSKPIFIKRGK